MALTRARVTRRIGAANEVILSSLALPQKGGTTIYDQSLVAIVGGYVEPFVPGTGLTAAGKAAIPNGQPFVAVNDGDNLVRVEQGVFCFAMGTSGNALAQTDVGKPVYGSDDQTVNKTDGGGLWSVAGLLVGIESSTQVQVFVALMNTDIGAQRNCEEIAASATLNVAIPTSRLTISGAKAYALPDGTRPGQRKRIYIVSDAATPSGVLTPAHASGFTTITFGAGSGKSTIDLEWDASLGTPAWKLVGVCITASGTVTIA